MAHFLKDAAFFLLAALCVFAAVLWFFTEGKTDRYAEQFWPRIRDSFIFGLFAPFWILYAILVNVAALLPWEAPGRLLTKLK